MVETIKRYGKAPVEVGDAPLDHQNRAKDLTSSSMKSWGGLESWSQRSFSVYAKEKDSKFGISASTIAISAGATNRVGVGAAGSNAAPLSTLCEVRS